MRTTVLLLVLLMIMTPFGLSQLAAPSFDRGNVSDNIYTNKTLGITWEMPSDWTAQNDGASVLGSEYVSIIRLLPGGPKSQELVEFDYSSSTAIANLSTVLQGKGWDSSQGTGYYSLGGGIPAHRDNYVSKDAPIRYLSVLKGQRRGDFALIFVADSAARVDELIKAALQMKVQADWGPPEEPLPLTPPGSLPRRVRVSQGVSQALLLKKVVPTYPAAAREAHIQGSVVMVAHISNDGSLKNLYVLSGPEPLVPAALDAVSQWQWKPYFIKGTPVEVETQVTVNFTLN